MSDENTTDILLRISADVAEMAKVQQSFVDMQKNAKEAGEHVSKLGENLKSLSTASVFALGAAFKVAGLGIDSIVDKIHEAISGTSDLSQKMYEVEKATGLAGEAAQVFARAGRIGFDELTSKLQRYRAALGAALIDPKGPQADLFKKQLGIDPNELNLQPVEQQLKTLADAFGNVTDATVQFRLAQELFGRGSGPMVAFLTRLRVEGYDAMRESVKATAGILSGEMSEAIHTQERAISGQTQRLAIEFGEINLRMLTVRATMAKLLADNAALIGSVGTSLALVSGVLAFVSAISAIKWAALGAGYGALMGPAIGLAVAGALVFYIAESMKKEIEHQDEEMEKIFRKNQRPVKDAAAATGPYEVAAARVNATNQIKQLQTKIDALEALRHDGNEGGEGERGLDQNEEQTLAIMLQQKATLEAFLKVKESVQVKNAQANAAAKAAAEAEAKRLSLATDLTKELDEAAPKNKAALDAAKYELATSEGKLEIIQAERATLAAKNTTELAILGTQASAVVLEEQANGIKLESLKIDEQEKKVLADIAAAKKKVADEELSAFREKLQKQKEFLTARQVEIQGQLSEIDGEYWRTEKEKYAEKLKLQTDLVIAAKQHLTTLQEIARLAKNPVEKQLADQAVDEAGKQVNAATKGKAKAGPDPNSTTETMRKQFAEMRNGFTSIAQVISGTFQSAINGISSSLAGLIEGTMTWGQALSNIGTTILTTVIDSISKMFAEWIIGKIMQATVGKAIDVGASQASIGIATETGLALAAIYATPAAMASVASYGAADAAGMVGLAAAVTQAHLLAATGFAKGGYTGSGAVNEVAGLVHKGEVVFSQKDVAAFGGAAAVDRMRVTGGHGNKGGGVMSRGGAAGGGRGPAVGKPQAVNQAFFTNSGEAKVWLASQEGRRIFTDMHRQATQEM